MQKEDFINDIPESVARAAHNFTSFVPGDRAKQEREGFAEVLAHDWERLSKMVANKPELHQTFHAEFERYRRGMREKKLKLLYSMSRCASTMITGGSNFPVERMRKRNDIAHRRVEDYVQFRNRAMAAITKTLCPELAPIMAGDTDAIQRLEAKIAEAEKSHAHMKEINALFKKAGGGADGWRAAMDAGDESERPYILRTLKLGFEDAVVSGNAFCVCKFSSRSRMRLKFAPLLEM